VALVAAAAASLVMPPARPAGAQAGTDRVTAGLRARNLAANAAIGAAVSGVRAAVRRRPVAPALARGLAGGVALGAGKQLAARRFGGAGAVGRLVTAAGVAAVYTAPGDSLAAFLPVGPVTVELRPGARDRVRPRVNGWTTAVLLVALFDANSRLDAGASLDAGAVVFRRRSGAMPWGGGELGFAFPGVVFVSDRAEDAARRRLVVAHEAVHVQQWDAYHATVTRDAGAGARGARAGRRAGAAVAGARRAGAAVGVGGGRVGAVRAAAVGARGVLAVGAAAAVSGRGRPRGRRARLASSAGAGHVCPSCAAPGYRARGRAR
jgi:hypothetical protein